MKQKMKVFFIALCMLVEIILPVSVQADTTTYSGSNVNAQDYFRWTTPVNSYLEKCEDGTLMRVQYVRSNKKVIVEYYDVDYQLIRTKELPQELSVFGGFYATDKNYYLVTGQENPEQSATVEVYRITKYDKEWNRLGSAGLYNCNTTIPFDAGSLRMDSWGKYLLIRTCHEMYKSSDGYNHQANVMIQVDTEEMKITDSFTEVMNFSYGYVSHSFNQFIKMEDGKIVAVDHGDGHPRSIVLCQYPTDVSGGTFRSNRVVCTNVLKFPGDMGENTTGATVGGFEISDASYLIAGNSVIQDEDNLTRSTRNVFLAAVDKETREVTVNWLTSYAEGETTTRTPHLVKITDDRFMVIWSRGNDVFYTECDGSGKQIGNVYCMEDASISDCLPIAKENKVIWYVWSFDKITFYEIDLNNITRPQGVVLQNGISITKTFCADLKHSIKYISHLDSTCTEDGHIAHWECEVCQMPYADAEGTIKYSKQEVVLPAMHTYENQGVTNGVAQLKCAVCGDTTEKEVITRMTIFGSEDNKNFSTAFQKTRKVGDILYTSISSAPAGADTELEVLISDTNVASYTKTSATWGYLTMLDTGVVTVTIRPKWNPEVGKSFRLVVECEDKQYQNTGIVNGHAVLVCSGCGSALKIPVMTSLNIWWNEDGGTTYYSSFSSNRNVNDVLYYYAIHSPEDVDSELEVLISDPNKISYNKTNDSLGYFTMLRPGTVTVTIRPKLNPNLAKKYTITIVGEEEPKVLVENIFEDVSAQDWYRDAAQYVYDNGIIKGVNETTFAPFINLTRAQFATILYRMEKSPAIEYNAKFPDVPDGDWFTDAVLWAAEKGIVTGYIHSGEFDPHGNITREQVALMMYRYAKLKGYDIKASGNLDTFADGGSVSGYAKDAMQWAVGKGIITGKENGTRIDPQGNTLRAECAVIIERFSNLI